jgi:hypothetical protein
MKNIVKSITKNHLMLTFPKKIASNTENLLTNLQNFSRILSTPGELNTVNFTVGLCELSSVSELFKDKTAQDYPLKSTVSSAVLEFLYHPEFKRSLESNFKSLNKGHTYEEKDFSENAPVALLQHWQGYLAALSVVEAVSLFKKITPSTIVKFIMTADILNKDTSFSQYISKNSSDLETVFDTYVEGSFNKIPGTIYSSPHFPGIEPHPENAGEILTFVHDLQENPDFIKTFRERVAKLPANKAPDDVYKLIRREITVRTNQTRSLFRNHDPLSKYVDDRLDENSGVDVLPTHAPNFNDVFDAALKEQTESLEPLKSLTSRVLQGALTLANNDYDITTYTPFPNYSKLDQW